METNQPENTWTEEKYPQYRWVIVVTMMFTQQIGTLVIGGLGVLLPSLRAELGFGLAQSGLLTGPLSWLPQILLYIPASLLLVRFNPKRVYMFALLLAAAAGFLASRATSFPFLAMVVSAMAAAKIIGEVPDTLLKVQWVPKHELGRVMGLNNAMRAMGQSASIIVIPFFLILFNGWRNVFLVYTMIVLLLAVVWAILGKERITPEYRRGMEAQAGRSPFLDVIKRKEFFLMGLGSFGFPFVYLTGLAFLPTYFLEERGMTLIKVGLILGVMPIGGIFSNLIMGYISDRIGLRKITIWPFGFILPIVFFALISPIPTWALPIFAFATGFAAWAPFPALRTIPLELPGLKPSEIVVGQALYMTFNMMGPLLGPLTVGYLAESFGSIGPALKVICLFPLTITIACIFLPETGPKARQKTISNT